MIDYQEALRKARRDEEIKNASLEAAMSGASTGAFMSGMGRVLSGGKRLTDIMKSAGIGGLMAGGMAGGATYLGSKIMGSPEDDGGTYASRAAMGGLLGGGLIGAGVGALSGSGALNRLAKMKFMTKLGEKTGGLTDNLIANKLKEWAANPGKASSAKSAALLASILGSTAGVVGSGEGMQLDYLRHLGDDNESY